MQPWVRSIHPMRFLFLVCQNAALLFVGYLGYLYK